ncbi:ABC transporter permease [Niabella drilacis]|nr:ABC transporter permease [Niabella drilacis]
MLKNYLITAWRSILRRKVFSLINITGLAVGIAAGMLIILYVKHERDFDLFHRNADRIFSMGIRMGADGDSLFVSRLRYTDAPVVTEREPSVAGFLRIRKGMEHVMIQDPAHPSVKFSEPGFAFADSNFFDFFSFNLLQGNSREVLQNPLSVVVSEATALKYFGTTDVMGRVLRYNNAYDLLITGVAENAPSNSSIRYDFVASLSSMSAMPELRQLAEKGRFDFLTFFTGRDDRAMPKVERSLAQLRKERDGEADGRFVGIPMQNFRAESGSDVNTVKYLKIFPFVAALILLLAMINYVSLATARAVLRVKEVGIRKVMGAGRSNLALQFFTESFLCIGMAFVLGYVLCAVLQTWLFGVLKINIDSSFIRKPGMLARFGVLFVVLTLLTSVYPSLLLSSFKPAALLYGRIINGGNAGVRRFFTIFQFAVAVLFVLCGIIIQQQIRYIKTADTGIDRDHVVTIPFGKDLSRHSLAFKHEVNSLGSIQKAAIALRPLFGGYDMTGVTPPGTEKITMMPMLEVDQDFISILGLQWKLPPADPLFYKTRQNVLLNEAAVAQLSPGKAPLSQKIAPFVVSGVLKDFNWKSLQYAIQPLIIAVVSDADSNAMWRGDRSVWTGSNGCLFVKIRAGANTALVLNQVKKLYQKYEQDVPFEYHFMDEAYDAMYRAEERLAIILSGFATLAIVIAGLGLLGLITFFAAQRVKEIGIRKVLGASAANIVTLLSVDFVKLVALAILIASPLAWYSMHRWLRNFAYHTEIRWWIFVLVGMGAILIALFTIAAQTFRAARANPAKSLRSEG